MFHFSGPVLDTEPSVLVDSIILIACNTDALRIDPTRHWVCSNSIPLPPLGVMSLQNLNWLPPQTCSEMSAGSRCFFDFWESLWLKVGPLRIVVALAWAAAVDVLLLCYAESGALPSHPKTGTGKQQKRSFQERHLIRLLVEAHGPYMGKK